ncbi:MAG: plasmid recombination protein [Ruminococcus sp.]|uniref:plasmid recombination protein n=1 Tax=Ruminococcus sp. TaxID=41978 RepID=UPI00399627AF
MGDFIGTTISGMTGRGSIRHNNRRFSAANIDRSRTEQNVTFCNDDLKQVYHEIFDEALEAYNAGKKKTRDKIPDYYEHIRQSKQEKLFHEAIFQIGNLNDCGCGTEGGQRAAEALIEYAKSFQERNPHLHVFNMVLHMDEATPHLHVDYIPVATEQTRGPVNESVHEAGAQAAGLYRCWSETDRVEGLDGSGEGSADGDRSAA